jgi:hypothetical protein
VSTLSNLNYPKIRKAIFLSKVNEWWI